MAEEDPTPLIGGDDGGRKPPNPKLVRGVLAIAALLLVVYLYNVFSTPDKPAPREKPAAEQSEKDKKDGRIDVATTPKESYAVPELDKRVTATTNEVQKLADVMRQFRESVDTKVGSLENKFDKRLGEMSEKITSFTYDTQEAVRRHAVASGVPLPTLPGGTVLAPGASGSLPPLGGGMGGGVSPISYVHFGTPLGAAAPSKDILDIGKDTKDQLGKVADATDKKLRDAAGVGAAAVKPKTRKVTLPSASYVHVTNLHGVDCPANSKEQSVVVILPVQGVWKGPNGETHDLGAAHLQAHCVGLENKVEGDTSRARITPTKLSYVGVDGTPQYITVSGYIVDRRDSSADVKGIYESRKGEVLAKSAAAAGIAAIGQISAAGEYTNVVGSSAGTVASTLTGNAGKAALGAAVGSAAERAANIYLQNVEALVPVVHLDGNLPLTFVTTSPFSVDFPTEDEKQALLR
jgi:hypothetical protein